jgi:hypothetical protein
VKPGSPSEASTCYAPFVAPPDGSESSCARDLTQFASSIFGVEGSVRNPSTPGGWYATKADPETIYAGVQGPSGAALNGERQATRRHSRGARCEGSVRARASKYNLCSRTCGDVPSRGFQDGQHRHGAAEELESAAIGGNVLVVAGVRAEEVAQFIVSPAEPGR